MKNPGLKIELYFEAQEECGEIFKAQVFGTVKNTEYGLVVNLDPERFESVGKPKGEIKGFNVYEMATHKSSGLKGRAWHSMKFLDCSEDLIPLYCVIA